MQGDALAEFVLGRCGIVFCGERRLRAHA
jgi:hypothetical protein